MEPRGIIASAISCVVGGGPVPLNQTKIFNGGKT
jgi:hypothetical protein